MNNLTTILALQQIKQKNLKKDLVSSVHNIREPQRHLLEKNGTLKFCDEALTISEESREEYSWEILRNFLRKIPKKFSGIFWNLFSYLIPLKISNKSFSGILGEAFRRISQEFLGVKFRRNSQEFIETNSLIKFPLKSEHMVTKS